MKKLLQLFEKYGKIFMGCALLIIFIIVVFFPGISAKFDDNLSVLNKEVTISDEGELDFDGYVLLKERELKKNENYRVDIELSEGKSEISSTYCTYKENEINELYESELDLSYGGVNSECDEINKLNVNKLSLDKVYSILGSAYITLDDELQYSGRNYLEFLNRDQKNQYTGNLDTREDVYKGKKNVAFIDQGSYNDVVLVTMSLDNYQNVLKENQLDRKGYRLVSEKVKNEDGTFEYKYYINYQFSENIDQEIKEMEQKENSLANGFDTSNLGMDNNFNGLNDDFSTIYYPSDGNYGFDGGIGEIPTGDIPDFGDGGTIDFPTIDIPGGNGNGGDPGGNGNGGDPDGNGNGGDPDGNGNGGGPDGNGNGGDGTEGCGIFDTECESDAPRLILDKNGVAPTGYGLELHGYATGEIDEVTVTIEKVTSSSSIVNGQELIEYSYDIVENDRQKKVPKGKYDMVYSLEPDEVYALTLGTNGIKKIDRQLFNTVDIWLNYGLKMNSDVSTDAMELEIKGVRNSDYVQYNSVTFNLQSTDGDTSDSYTVSRADLSNGFSHLFTGLEPNTQYYPVVTSNTLNNREMVVKSLSNPVYTRASIPYFQSLETPEYYVEKSQYQPLDVKLSSDSGIITEMMLSEIDSEGNDIQQQAITLQKKPGDNVFEGYFYNSNKYGEHNYKIDDFTYFDNYEEIKVNEYNGVTLAGNSNKFSNYVLKDAPTISKSGDFISYNDVSLDLQYNDIDSSVIKGTGKVSVYEDSKKIDEVSYNQITEGIPIQTCSELSSVGGDASNIGTYYLTSDLECTSQIDDFYGTLNGNGHTIVYSGSNSLFKYIGEEGVVENLNLYVDIENSDEHLKNLGSLVSVLDGKINNVSVKGFVQTGSTSENVGGIAGLINSTAAITNSYVNVDLSGGQSIGGLVGYNDHGKIDTAYSIGSVSGVLGVGGIVGNYSSTKTQGEINNVYTAMNILAKDDTINQSFGPLFGLVCMDYSGKPITGCNPTFSDTYVWNGIKINGFSKGNYQPNTNLLMSSYVSSSQLASPTWYRSKGFTEENGFSLPTDVNVMFGPRISSNITSFYDDKLQLHNVESGKDFDLKFELQYNRGDGEIRTKEIDISTKTFERKALDFIYNVDQLESNSTTLRIDINQDICPNDQLLDLTDTDGDGIVDSCDLTPNGEEVEAEYEQIINSILNIVEYDSRTLLVNSGIVELYKVNSGKYSLVDFTPYYSEYTVENIQTGVPLNTCGDLSKVESDPKGTFYLNGNIDCNGITYNTVDKFEGSIFGNGYEIQNLNKPLINENLGTISGLGLIIDFDSSESEYGAIRENNGIISKVYVSGNVLTNGSTVGMLVGVNNGTIIDSYAKGNVTGYMNVGGLVGINNGDISTSFATGYVSGSSNKLSTSYPTTCNELRGNVGGLVGCNGTSGSVGGYNYSLISGEESEIGASIGYDLGTINNLYYSTPNDMSNYGAGIKVSQEQVNDSNFYYNTLGFDPDVWSLNHDVGENYIGNTGPILKEELLKTYIEDEVSYYNASQLQYDTDYSWILNFNYMDSLGSVHNGSTERSIKTNVLQAPQIEYSQIDSPNEGELVFDLNVIDNDHTVVLEKNKSLYVENSSKAEYGDDWRIPGETIDQMYIPISTCDQLSVLNDKDSNYSYRLINDVDCAGVDLKQITKFNGTFNGNGYTISNLHMNTSLFDQINGSLYNLNLENGEFGDSLSGSGILAEVNNGTISTVNIKNTTLSGKDNIAGIVNENTSKGRIIDVNFDGTINGKDNVSGIAVNNNGIIENVEVNGSINGVNQTAGVSVFNNDSIINVVNNSDVTGQTKTAGIASVNNKKIDVVENQGHINGNKDTGGIVGENLNEFQNASNYGVVDGVENTGGIVGHNKAKLNSVQNEGKINGETNTGGIIGVADNFEVSKLINTGDVSGKLYTGGIIGDSKCNLKNVKNDAAINGEQAVGGIVGYNENNTISRVINSGDISGVSKVGGIVGENISNIDLAKSTSGNTISAAGDYAGGIVGYQSKGTITNVENGSNVQAANYAGGLVGGIISSQNIANTNNIEKFNVTNTVNLSSSVNVGGITGIVDNGSNKTSGSINISNGIVSANIENGSHRGSLTGYYVGTDKTSSNHLINPKKQPVIKNITSNMNDPFIGYLKDGVEGVLYDARNRSVSMYGMNIPIGGINQMKDNSSYISSTTNKSFMVGDMRSNLVESGQVEKGSQSDKHHYSFKDYRYIKNAYVDPLKDKQINDKTSWTDFDNCVKRYRQDNCSPVIGASGTSTLYNLSSESTKSFYSPVDTSSLSFETFKNKDGSVYSISPTSMFQFTTKYSVEIPDTFIVDLPSITRPDISSSGGGYGEFEQSSNKITIRNISNDHGKIIVRLYYDTGDHEIKSVENTFEYSNIK